MIYFFDIQSELKLPNEIYSFLPPLKSILDNLPVILGVFLAFIVFVFLAVLISKNLNQFKASKKSLKKLSFEQRWLNLDVEKKFDSYSSQGDYFGALSILLREAFEDFSGITVTDMTAGEISKKVFDQKPGSTQSKPSFSRSNVPHFEEFLFRSEKIQFAELKVDRDEAKLWYQRVGGLIKKLRKSKEQTDV